MRKGISALLAIILIAAIAALAFLNQRFINLNVWFDAYSIPLWGVIAGVSLAGMLAAVFLTLGGSQKNRDRLADRDASIEELKQSREQAIKDARTDSEVEILRQKAEIDGLKQRVYTLEEELRHSLAERPPHKSYMEEEIPENESGEGPFPERIEGEEKGVGEPTIHSRSERRALHENTTVKPDLPANETENISHP